MIPNFNSWTFDEALSENTGKSSIRLLLGFLYCCTSIIMALCGTLGIFLGWPGAQDVFIQSSVIGTMGTGLIALSRLTKDKPLTTNGSQEIKQETN